MRIDGRRGYGRCNFLLQLLPDEVLHSFGRRVEMVERQLGFLSQIGFPQAVGPDDGPSKLTSSLSQLHSAAR